MDSLTDRGLVRFLDRYLTGAREYEITPLGSAFLRVLALEEDRSTNPASVLDLNPNGPVGWSEVFSILLEEGWSGGVVDARTAWDYAVGGRSS